MKSRFLILSVLMLLTMTVTPLYAQQDTRSEEELIAALNVPDDSDASVRQFSLAAKQLAVTGTEACLPALAAKLDNPRFSHFARYGLEPNPSPKVDEIFAEALKTFEDETLLIGVINSIGERKAPGTIEKLKSLRGGTSVDVTTAMLSAISLLGTPEAAEELLEVVKDELGNAGSNGKLDLTASELAAIGNSAFRCAELLDRKGNAAKAVELYDAVAAADYMPGYVKEAAVYNAILARKADGLALVVKNLTNDDWDVFATSLKAARELPGQIGETLLKETGNLSPERKAMVLEAIGNRGEKIVLPELIAGVKSDNKAIRLASVRALKYAGDASAVDVLLAAAVDSDAEVAGAARNTLIRIPGDTVDAKIADVLKNGEAQAKITAVKLVEERRIQAAFPVLIAMSVDSSNEVRKAVAEAIGETAGLEEIPALYDLLAQATAENDINDLKKALKSACGRQPQNPCAGLIISLYEKSPLSDAKLFLLELLATVRGKKAVEFIGLQAWVNDTQIKDAATEVLGNWPDTDAADPLLKIAKESRQSKYQIRGVRGYVRLARQFGMEEARRIEMCKTAFDVAKRDEDKVLIFDVMPRYPSETMLAFAVSYFDSPFKEKAYAAAVAVADKVQGKPALVAEALKKVIEAASDADLKAKARQILDRK
ncbi:MAG: HEAT repeat domain-containing protein [Planctomycetaceae bacterium]|jgi:HEAT repeat protein|nr:HEAT repeat domain-containing protein [Planctomycetaceae bacterium]